MEPSELYLKAKRMLALASAVLLLSLTVGIDFDTGNGLLPVKISDTSWVNEVFVLGVVYFLRGCPR